MSKASLQDITAFKNNVVEAALELAASKSWDDVSMYAIARQADVDNDDLTALFEDKEDILAAYAAQVDKRVDAAFQGEDTAQDSERDRLFDVLMERFDILNENREAVTSILNTITLDPKQGIDSLPHLCKSMRRMANTAGITLCGLRGAIKITALTILYLKLLRDWVKDDSPDMAATMAGLDKALSYYEKI